MSDFQYTPPVVGERSVTTEALVSRQAQEVQAAMVVAKRFPRDEMYAYNRIMKSCERKKLAENALYEFSRGDSKVTGPSIRLAEELARNWGNIDSGVLELEQKNGESTVMAYAWDLETNTRQTKIFTVRHERKTKKAGIIRLDDPRDIYEMVASQGARRVRACILAVIPGDVVDAAVEKCQQTLINGYSEPLIDRVRKIVAAFDKNFQVSLEMLEKYIGCKAESFSEHDYIRLQNVGRALKDGMAKREDYFEVRTAAKSTTSKTEEEFMKEFGGAMNESAASSDQSELLLDGSEQDLHE